jgi:hypothetical protein
MTYLEAQHYLRAYFLRTHKVQSEVNAAPANSKATSCIPVVVAPS